MEKRPGLSIRVLFPAFVALLIIVSIGLTLWQAVNNWRSASSTLAETVVQMSGDEIRFRVQGFLVQHEAFVDAQAKAIMNSRLELQNPQVVHDYLRRQVTGPLSIDNVFIGYPNGDFVGVSVQTAPNGEETIQTTVIAEGRPAERFEYDLNDNFVGEYEDEPNDPREDDWYQESLLTGNAAWSSEYARGSESTLTTAMISPITNPEGEVIAVFGSELTLDAIADFLAETEILESGTAYIFEAETTELIATSDPDLEGSMGAAGQLSIDESDNAILQGVKAQLEAEFNAFGEIEEPLSFKDVTMGGETYFVQVAPVEAGEGIDWLVVVAIPEDDIFASIGQTTRSTSMAGLSILVVALAVGVGMAVWVTNPIMAMAAAASSIEDESFDLTSLESVSNRRDEFGQLARVTKSMAEQVHKRETKLKEQVRQLQIEIDQTKVNEQIDAITDTEFFTSLQDQAKEMRNRRSKRTNEDEA